MPRVSLRIAPAGVSKKRSQEDFTMKHKLSLSGALALFLSAPIREGGLALGARFPGRPGQRLEAAGLEIGSTLPADLSLLEGIMRSPFLLCPIPCTLTRTPS